MILGGIPFGGDNWMCIWNSAVSPTLISLTAGKIVTPTILAAWTVRGGFARHTGCPFGGPGGGPSTRFGPPSHSGKVSNWTVGLTPAVGSAVIVVCGGSGVTTAPFGRPAHPENRNTIPTVNRIWVVRITLGVRIPEQAARSDHLDR